MTSFVLPPLSLKSRITLATLCILLASLWALSFFAGQALRRDMERLLGEQQLSAVSWVGIQVNSELETRFKALEKKAAALSIAMRTGPDAMQSVLDQSPILQMLFNAGSVAYRIDDQILAEVHVVADRRDVNYMAIDTVAAEIKQGRRSINLSGLTANPRTPIVAMIVPITDETGVVIGALAGEINLTIPNFLGQITDSRYGRTGGYLLVVPQERLVLMATDKSRILERLPAAGAIPLIDRFMTGYEGYGVVVNPVGVEVLASAKGVPVAGWYVATLLPTEEAFEPFREMQQRMRMITLLLAVLAAGVTWWILKIQLSPLRRTAKALTAMSNMSNDSQLIRPLPSGRNDEIGQVISGFNRLVETLGKRETALQDTEWKFRALFEKGPIGVAYHEMIYDDQGKPVDYRFLDANEAYNNLTGVDPRGKTVKQIFPEIDQDPFNWIGTFGRVARTGEQIRVEQYFQSNGCWYDIVAYQYKPDQFVAAFLNITERKRAESALHDSEMKLEAIFNASPAAMSVADANNDFRTVSVNMAWERQFRRQRQDVLGQNAQEMGLWANAADRDRFLAALSYSGCVNGMEAELLAGDGQRMLCVISSLVTEIHGNRLQLMMAVDITERRRIENEIQALNHELEERVASRTEQLSSANAELAASLENLHRAQDELLRTEKLASLGALVAGIAHELNTPIGNAVTVATTLVDLQKAFSGQIETGLSRAVLREFVDDVGEAGQILDRNLHRAVELVGSFKQLAVDQSSYQRRRFELHALVHEILLAMGPAVRKTSYTVCDEVQTGLVLDSYPGPLGQILMNLINNALIHAFEGKETGTVRIQAQALEPGLVIVSVNDDGCGIPVEHQKRIFDPFFTTRLGQGGSGLGLHIVFNLVVDLLGGRIDVASEPGKGCVFSMRLPLVAPQAKVLN